MLQQVTDFKINETNMYVYVHIYLFYIYMYT